MFDNQIHFQSLFVIVAKAKSLILSFKICEELSAAQKLESAQILLLAKSQIVEIMRTVRQRFFSNRVCLFSFFTMAANDRGYGHLAGCGSFTVALRQSECGSKNLLNARQPVNDHRRVLGAVHFIRYIVILLIVSVSYFCHALSRFYKLGRYLINSEAYFINQGRYFKLRGACFINRGRCFIKGGVYSISWGAYFINAGDCFISRGGYFINMGSYSINRGA